MTPVISEKYIICISLQIMVNGGLIRKYVFINIMDNIVIYDFM